MKHEDISRIADAVERVAARVDGVMARRDAEGVENWVYSGKESSHISRHPTLEAAKREANKQETKTGYEHHVNRLKPTGPGSYAVHSRHFPDWNRVQSGNRSNWTSEKGEPQDRVYMKAKRLGAKHDADDPTGLAGHGWFKGALNKDGDGVAYYEHKDHPGHVISTHSGGWAHETEPKRRGRDMVELGSGGDTKSLNKHLASFHGAKHDDAMADADISGRRVIVQHNAETQRGGMPEFHNKTGTVGEREGRHYRVHLDEPVHVPGVGKVKDDLWERSKFKLLKD